MQRQGGDDLDLRALIDAWPSLPATTRRTILSLARRFRHEPPPTDAGADNAEARR